MASDRRRVLSIQSHVVSGYVGNKAATFPLQMLGFDVDALNTLQFSNHTGYPVFKGMVMPQSHYNDILDGLTENGLLGRYSHVLTGYLGSASTIQAVCEVVKRLRQANPNNLLYGTRGSIINTLQSIPSSFHDTTVLDPVMGDEGKLYVRPETVPLYRELLCPLADLITPNQFELELLTDIKIQSMADAQRAVLKLQETVPAVVLTSFSLPQQPDGNINDDDHDNQCLYLMGCCRGSSGCFTIKFPRRHGYFTGTGDLFAALLLAHYHYECLLNNGNNGIALAKACEIAVEIMQSVLELTCSKYNSNDIGNTNDKSRQVKGMELRLIESRHLFQRTANGGGGDANSGGVAEMKAQVINYLIK